MPTFGNLSLRTKFGCAHVANNSGWPIPTPTQRHAELENQIGGPPNDPRKLPKLSGLVYTMGSEQNFEGVWYPRNSLIKMEYVGSEKIWSGARQTWQILLPGLHGRPSFNPLNPLPGAPPPPPSGSMHQQEMGSPVGGFPSISPHAAQHMGPTSTSSSFSPNHYPLIPTSIIPCSSWPPEASSTPLGTHRPAWMSVDNPP